MAAVIGIDAAAGQWLGILLIDGSFDVADLQATVGDLLQRHPEVEVAAVDIPIGLPVGRLRVSDLEARRFVGARSSSVFATLPQEVLEAATHEQAVAAARRVLGVGISRQAFALRARILEVQAIASADPRIVEVHPEVSFAALNGRPLRYSKHSWNGIAERRSLLEGAGILLPANLVGGGRAAPDDVVDAAVAAWSAERMRQGRSETLPAERPVDPALGGVIHY